MNRQLLPEAQRKRMTCRGRRPDFVIGSHGGNRVRSPETHAPEIWTRKAYGSTIASVYGLNPALLRDPHLHVDRFREKYRSSTQDAPAARAHYDVYFDAARGALTYARAPCVPADLVARFFLHVVPEDADDLPDHRVQYGFDNRDFNLPEQALFDRKCLATVRLPEYAVDHVRTGQFTRRGTGEDIRYDNVWTGSFSPDDLDGAGGVAPPR